MLTPQFPTVRFIHRTAAVNNSTIQSMMTALHQQLLLSGWTIEWANAGAIGTGTLAAPAWSAPFAANSDSGIVVYRMPTRGHATSWFVRLRMGFGATTSTNTLVRGLTIGEFHDGAGGVTGGISEAPNSGVGTSPDVAFSISSSEDGFVLATNTHFLLNIERVRRPDGTVEDDIIAYYYSGTSVNVISRLVRRSVGEVHRFQPLALGSHTSDHGGTSSVVTPVVSTVSVVSRDGAFIPILGPYWVGGYPFFGPNRHLIFTNVAEHPLDSERRMQTDGQLRVYRVLLGTTMRVMVAVT